MGYDYTFKVLLLGDPSSGKEEIVNRYLSSFFLDDTKLTIGVDFYSKTQEFRGKKVKLQIWDFGGEERFRFLLHQYCKEKDAAMIMYDITNRLSLYHLPDWTQIIREHAGDIPILLIGNKIDLEKYRSVTKEEGILAAKKYNLSGCVEVSSKTGKNVEKVFEAITRLLLANADYQIKKQKYEEFIVYELKNTGDRTKLNITPEELQNHLNPKKVLIIITNDLKRIYIWKGSKSPVRKRFIAARVAQDLQRELIKDARYQRCKIVSIDQGDELQEFLNAFGLESMEVTERLPDMRYIRKSELDRWLEPEHLAREKKDGKVKSDDKYYFSGLENILERELKGRESYRDRIITLLSKIQRFWDLRNSRNIAILVQGSDTILYSTDNWDIRADVGRVISGWNSMSAQSIMFSGVKYSVLQCTSEILFATSFRGKGHIIGAKDDDFTLILHIEPDGDDAPIVYPYIFTPPRPPDDFEMAPQVQLRAPLKEKEPEEKINCQYCGRELTKGEQLTHSCQKKPKKSVL